MIRAITGDRRGATAVEYGMIVALVTLATVAVIVALGGSVAALWHDILTQVLAIL